HAGILDGARAARAGQHVPKACWEGGSKPFENILTPSEFGTHCQGTRTVLPETGVRLTKESTFNDYVVALYLSIDPERGALLAQAGSSTITGMRRLVARCW